MYAAILRDPALREIVARMALAWIAEDRKWQTPKYIRSYRAGLASRTRRNGRLPNPEELDPLWAEEGTDQVGPRDSASRLVQSSEPEKPQTVIGQSRIEW